MKAEDTYYFPLDISSEKLYQAGITVRDKLAESAMIGLIGSAAMVDDVSDTTTEWVARNSYRIADALLSQSNK